VCTAQSEPRISTQFSKYLCVHTTAQMLADVHELAHVASAGAYPGSTAAFILVNYTLIDYASVLAMVAVGYLGLEWRALALASKSLAPAGGGGCCTLNAAIILVGMAVLLAAATTTNLLAVYSKWPYVPQHVWMGIQMAFTVLVYLYFAYAAIRMHHMFKRQQTQTAQGDRMLARAYVVKRTCRA